MVKKNDRAAALRRSRFAKEFESAWDERTSLSRDAFALRQQMEQEDKLKALADELAAEADALEALATQLAPRAMAA